MQYSKTFHSSLQRRIPDVYQTRTNLKNTQSARQPPKCYLLFIDQQGRQTQEHTRADNRNSVHESHWLRSLRLLVRVRSTSARCIRGGKEWRAVLLANGLNFFSLVLWGRVASTFSLHTSSLVYRSTFESSVVGKSKNLVASFCPGGNLKSEPDLWFESPARYPYTTHPHSEERNEGIWKFLKIQTTALDIKVLQRQFRWFGHMERMPADYLQPIECSTCTI